MTDQTAPTRTEADIAAETVAILVHHGIIDPHQVDTAIREAGIEQVAYTRAVNRRRRVGWARPFRPNLPVTPPAPAVPVLAERPTDLAPATRQRKTRTVDGTVELFCPGGGHQIPHWAPETEFQIRADRPWARRTRCVPCARRTSRSRYVSVAAREALHAIGVTITVDTGSALLAVACPGCGETFTVGDQAAGDTVVMHTHCAALAHQSPTEVAEVL